MLTELFLKNFLFVLDKFVNLNYKIIGSWNAMDWYFWYKKLL